MLRATHEVDNDLSPTLDQAISEKICETRGSIY